MIKMTFSAIALAFLAGTAVQAASPKSLGQFNSWSAAAYDKGDLTHCFIMSKPAVEDPLNLRHGDVFFFVQTADNGKNTESSFQTGYDFAANSTVTITIGDDEFRMLTQGSNAWLAKVEREPALLAAMRAGSDMILEARSARGNATSYTFPLAGVTAASRLLQRCDAAAAQS